MVKVSVIVPVYNIEKYLGKCLDSLINQSLSDVEIICVNDGSTDNSPKILENYARKDKRIKVINKENGGLSSARNKGLEVASGKYVGFVDSDDWVDEQTYELAYNAIEKTRADYVAWGAKVEVEDDDKNLAEAARFAAQYHSLKLIGLHTLDVEVFTMTPVTVWNKLFKSEIIKKYNLKFPQGLLFEDNEFFIEYFGCSKQAYYIDKYLYHYLQRKNSIMAKHTHKGVSSNKPIDYVYIYEHIYNFYKEHNLLNLHSEILSTFFSRCVLFGGYQLVKDKKLYKKEIEKLAKIVDNSIIKNEHLELINKNKLYKVEGLKAIKYDFGNNLLGVQETANKFEIRLLGLRLLFSKSFFYSKKIKNNYKRIKILGINFKFKCKNKKAKFGCGYELEGQEDKLRRLAKGLVGMIKYVQEPIVCQDVAPAKKTEFSPDIKQAMKDMPYFYFYPNVGNLGDGIIAEAEYKILNNGDYNYSIFDNDTGDALALNQEFNLVYGGGGLFVKYWNYQKVLEIFKNRNLQKCVVLPSSFWQCDDVLECFDERFTVFCRERRSYEYCISQNKKAKFVLADDMAFSLNVWEQSRLDVKKIEELRHKLSDEDCVTLFTDICPTLEKLYNNVQNALQEKTIINSDHVRIGYFLRTDAERKMEEITLPTIDLSVFANSPCVDTGVVATLSSIFIGALKSVDVVVTDRLHIGLVASLLDKEVYMLDNSYGKVSGIYEYSMKKFVKTKVIENFKGFSIDAVQTTISNVDWDIVNKKFDLNEYVNIYLSNLKYETTLKNTIWSVK